MDFYTDGFFLQNTVQLAKSLLGKLLIVKNTTENESTTDSEKTTVSGYIVETEAYLGIQDRACHGWGGKKTKKTQALYENAGTIYIYTIHTHKMLNIVACEKDNPQAVLIRAVEPVSGLDIMAQNRKRTPFVPAASFSPTTGSALDITLTNGPGKLTQAMGIGDIHNMTMIQTGSLCIDFEHSKTPKAIGTSERIGIPNKGIWTHKKLRFFVQENKFVSGIKKSDWQDFPWR